LLGLGYFIAEISGRVADRIDTAPLWLSGIGLLSFVLLIPAVKQVNRLNIDHEVALEKNSKYHWTTIGFIVMFVPILLLVMIGMFS